VLLKGVMSLFMPENVTLYTEHILVSALLGLFILIYNGVGYKHFVLGLIFLFMGAMGVAMFTSYSLETVLHNGTSVLHWDIPFVIAVLMGYVILFLGHLMGTFFAKLFYKRPMSSMAFGALVKRALQ